MRRIAYLVVIVTVMALAVGPSLARPQYKDSFDRLYGIDVDRPQRQETQDLKIRVARVRCNLCHVPDQEKSERNQYGEALEPRLPAFDANAWRDPKRRPALEQQIYRSLRAVEPEAGDHRYRYGDLIKNGYLPNNLNE